MEKGADVSAAREEILKRIRRAGAAESLPPIARGYRRTPGSRSRQTRTALFCERVRDYRAEVHLISAGDASQAIAAASRRHAARRLGIPTTLNPDWKPSDLELVSDEQLDAGDLDHLDGVITGCTVAIAETGTIVLSGGSQEGRRALSLVPDLHVCVLGETQIVDTMPEAVTHLEPLARQGRPITFISGPSATSDIELSRVEGVHGPRTLIVLVIQDGDDPDRAGADHGPGGFV